MARNVNLWVMFHFLHVIEVGIPRNLRSYVEAMMRQTVPAPANTRSSSQSGTVDACCAYLNHSTIAENALVIGRLKGEKEGSILVP
jgi:hypothetical protein